MQQRPEDRNDVHHHRFRRVVVGGTRCGSYRSDGEDRSGAGRLHLHRAVHQSIRENQDQVYDDFINYVNAHGGVAGRRIVPDYQMYCPIQSAQALSLCTSFTEDDHVFAVMGDFVDFSGDAQTCIAKDHNTVLLTFDLTQAIINQSPPGLIILPGTTPERTTPS